MSKVMLLFLAAIIAVMLLSGILEINFQPQKYADIPGVANSVLKEKSTYEKGRSFVVLLKRKSELFIVRDKEKTLVLSLLYVKSDAERLKDLTDRQLNAASLLPQAELLVWSIEQVRSHAEKAPVEVVASMKDESAESFALAQQALSGLQDQYQEYEMIHTEFTRLTDSLQEQIGQLGLEDPTGEEAVAGAADDASNGGELEVKSNSAEKSAIPLQF